jgi:hypothetical protein
MRDQYKFEQYIINRLEEWGIWFSDRDYELGYGRKNILAKIQEQCGDYIRGSENQFYRRNEEAEKIEEIVIQLYGYRPQLAEVLRIRYFYPLNYEWIATRAGYTRTRYYAILKLAHEWISGYFSGAQKNF